MSTFSWMDHSESQRRRMLEIVATFQEQDTVDELGIGSVRDALSDTLLPGTSVLFTRARYLLFVPWICQGIEHDRIPPERARRRLRNDEIRLIYALEAGGERLGVVGREARERTQRLPSVFYWGALGRYRIRTFPGTISQWQQSLSGLAGGARRSVVADDGSLVDASSARWHPSLPRAPEGFLDEITFALRPVEAEYLQERILAVAPGGFLAHLIVSGKRDLDVSFAWEHPAAATAPPAVREHLDHARTFSEVMHGAALLYNLLLAEEVESLRSAGGQLVVDEDMTDHYRQALFGWVAMMDARTADHDRWHRAAFWDLATAHNPRIPYHTRLFVDRWLDLALDRPDAIPDDPEARTLVRNREIQVKRGLARLNSARQLERWSGASGTGRLDYRFGNVRLMLDDIIAGIDQAREASRAGA